jgi:hypothetical protein
MAKQNPVQQEELHHPQGAEGGEVGRFHGQCVPATTEIDGAGRDDAHGECRDHQAREGQRAEGRDLTQDGSLRVIEPDPTTVQLEGRHRPHRGGEHVGKGGVHAEEADEDAQNGQAGNGGDT